MTRFATWNVNSIRARLDHVSRWLQASGVDVLALQETKVRDEDFPVAEFEALGYQCAYAGQKSYNGVAVVSRLPLTTVATDIPGFADEQRRVLAVEVAGVTLLDLYVPNGQAVGSEKYAYKLDWLDALARWTAQLVATRAALLVMGDFNVAPADEDVHDPDAWRGKILCSEPERARLAALSEQGLGDAFRCFEQPPQSFSWWDYRAGGFRRNRGLRIDLVLAAPALGDALTGCRIDTGPRGWEKPSDHAPVIAEFAD